MPEFLYVLIQHPEAKAKGLGKPFLFVVEHLAYEFPVLYKLGIDFSHVLHHLKGGLFHEFVPEPQDPSVTDSPPDNSS